MSNIKNNIISKSSSDHIPILHVRGSYYTVGYTIGRTFKSMISELLETWGYFNDELLPEYHKPKGQEIYFNSLSLCQKKFPHYIEEIKGMAEGSNIDFYKLFLLNIDSIITSNDDGPTRSEQSIETGCTSIICNKDEVALGHTEDALKEIFANIYVVSAEICNDNGETVEKFTSLCYAGHLMGYTMGYNENGMVYSVNTLFPNVYISGTPRAFIARALLNSSSLDQVLDILRDVGTGISDGLSLNLCFRKHDNKTEFEFYNIEVSPPTGNNNESKLDVITINNGETFVHSNKYLRIETHQSETPLRCSSCRHTTIDCFKSIDGINDIKVVLSDQSNKEYPIYICNNVDTKMKHIKTVAVGIFDLKEKTYSIYTSPPAISCPLAVIKMNMQ